MSVNLPLPIILRLLQPPESVTTVKAYQAYINETLEGVGPRPVGRPPKEKTEPSTPVRRFDNSFLQAVEKEVKFYHGMSESSILLLSQDKDPNNLILISDDNKIKVRIPLAQDALRAEPQGDGVIYHLNDIRFLNMEVL